ncbi:MAG TPA: hypothetical protein V6D47_14270 [Oscillatoriaceae cyanobacterium]
MQPSFEPGATPSKQLTEALKRALAPQLRREKPMSLAIPMIVEGAVLLALACFWGPTLTQPVRLDARRDLRGALTVTLVRPTLLGIDRRTLDGPGAALGTHWLGKTHQRASTTIGGFDLYPMGLDEQTPRMRDFVRSYDAFYHARGGPAALHLELVPPAYIPSLAWSLASIGAATLAIGLKTMFTTAAAPEPAAPQPVRLLPPVVKDLPTPLERSGRDARGRLWLARAAIVGSLINMLMACWAMTVGIKPTTLSAHRDRDGLGSVVFTRPTLWGVQRVRMTLAQAGRAYNNPSIEGQSAVTLGGVPLAPLGIAKPQGVIFDIARRYNRFYDSAERPADFRAASQPLNELVPFAWVYLVAGLLGLAFGIRRAHTAQERLDDAS